MRGSEAVREREFSLVFPIRYHSFRWTSSRAFVADFLCSVTRVGCIWLFHAHEMKRRSLDAAMLGIQKVKFDSAVLWPLPLPAALARSGFSGSLCPGTRSSTSIDCGLSAAVAPQHHHYSASYMNMSGVSVAVFCSLLLFCAT